MENKDNISKEAMVKNWNKFIILLAKSKSGESSIKYDKSDDNNIKALSAEFILQFESPLRFERLFDSEVMLKEAKKEVEGLNLKAGEITSKQRMLIDAIILRNSIVRADHGELKMNLYKNEAVGGLVVGLSVDLRLQFDEPLPVMLLTEDTSD